MNKMHSHCTRKQRNEPFGFEAAPPTAKSPVRDAVVPICSVVHVPSATAAVELLHHCTPANIMLDFVQNHNK